MSIINEGMAACPQCGNRNTIKVYRSINVADNPELKEKVKDGSLFLWECPHCGKVNLAKYETLYHDPAGKLMVWLIPDDSVSETQMKAIENHTKAMGDYTLRTVSDMGSLMEKVLIHDAALDDVVIEMCKYVTKMEMASKAGSQQAAQELMNATFHFYRLNGEDGTITFMYPGNGQMVRVDIGCNVYEDAEGILQRNPHVRPEPGFARIDAGWLSSKIR